MRNRAQRKVKAIKPNVNDQIKKFFREKEFTDGNGNCFVVTDRGLFYCPKGSGAKKNPCPDCFFCQWCSDSRCGLCRRDPESCLGGKGSPD
ncbi:MAG: hypothetical protein AMJ94_11260 [Deltaproteobacteria bacterium SM23_61]|nr:MAG: hypothetical protein AMJ94_11260 [Deltaproteobacteria bacterium SM23_61]